MSIFKRISVIAVVIVMTVCMTVSSIGIGGTIHIIDGDESSAAIRYSASFEPTGSTATAATEMDYGFCTITTEVVCHYLDTNSATVKATGVRATNVDYKVSVTATAPYNFKATGVSSYHKASSPDSTLSNEIEKSSGILADGY